VSTAPRCSIAATRCSVAAMRVSSFDVSASLAVHATSATSANRFMCESYEIMRAARA
jgi:hypothetical protein